MRKPASTRTPAITRGPQIRFLPPTEINRQPIHRAHQISDRRGRGPRAWSGHQGQALPNDVGFRAPALSRLGLVPGPRFVRAPEDVAIVILPVETWIRKEQYAHHGP